MLLATSKTSSILNHTNEPELRLFKPVWCPISYDNGQALGAKFLTLVGKSRQSRVITRNTTYYDTIYT